MSRPVPVAKAAVLVVEDEALVRLRAVDIVEAAGFAVVRLSHPANSQLCLPSSTASRANEAVIVAKKTAVAAIRFARGRRTISMTFVLPQHLPLGIAQRRHKGSHRPLPYHNLCARQHLGLLLQQFKQRAGKTATGLADLRDLTAKRRLQVFDETGILRIRRSGEQD